MYYVGEQIEFQLNGQIAFETGTITNILDSAFVSNNDTIKFNSVNIINIRNKRASTIVDAAAPVFITAGVVLLTIDFINRGLIQGDSYTWDSGIGKVSAALVVSGALIILLKKNKINLKENGWWRLRKAVIY